jgi:hypothetical protein
MRKRGSGALWGLWPREWGKHGEKRNRLRSVSSGKIQSICGVGVVLGLFVSLCRDLFKSMKYAQRSFGYTMSGLRTWKFRDEAVA